jgi:hypothetical protein
VAYFTIIRHNIIHGHNESVGVVLAAWGSKPMRPGEVTFRSLPPPASHKGVLIADTSMEHLCHLYVEYLQAMFDSFAPVAFEVQDRYTAEFYATHVGPNGELHL